MTRLRWSSRWDAIGIVLLGAALFLPGLGSHDLWNPDEPRYAEVTREMLASGDYLVPHLNGAVYQQKPPLLFWSMAAAAKLTGGLDEVAARLPSALAAVGTLLLTFLLGRQELGRRAAWVAVLALGTGVKFFWQGRVGQIDMLLTFLVALAVACWWRGELCRDGRWALAFFAVAGLATLAKGPAGFLPPLLAILAFYTWSRDHEGWQRLRLGWGVVLWAAVVAAWLLPAAARVGGDYLATLVWKQNVTRYADPWGHHRPWWYFLGVLPFDFFPWSFLLLGAVVSAWRRLCGPEGRFLRFLLCWAAVTLVFFSLSPGKRTVYILPMYPALALLVGAAFDGWAAYWPRQRRWLTRPLAALAGLLILIAFALPWAVGRRPEAGLFPDWLPQALATLAGTVAAAAGLAFLLARRGRVVAAAGALAGGVATVWLAAVLLVLPPFDRVKSARPLAMAYLELAKDDEPYATYPRLDAPFLYYTGRPAVPLASEEALDRFARLPGRQWLFIERDDLRRLRRPLPLVEVARDPEPREGYVLMTDPSPSSP